MTTQELKKWTDTPAAKQNPSAKMSKLPGVFTETFERLGGAESRLDVLGDFWAVITFIAGWPSSIGKAALDRAANTKPDARAIADDNPAAIQPRVWDCNINTALAMLQSIAIDGVKVTVDLDDKGRVLDGLNRVQLAALACVKYNTRIVKGDADDHIWRQSLRRVNSTEQQIVTWFGLGRHEKFSNRAQQKADLAISEATARQILPLLLDDCTAEQREEALRLMGAGTLKATAIYRAYKSAEKAGVDMSQYDMSTKPESKSKDKGDDKDKGDKDTDKGDKPALNVAEMTATQLAAWLSVECTEVVLADLVKLLSDKASS